MPEEREPRKSITVDMETGEFVPDSRNTGFRAVRSGPPEEATIGGTWYFSKSSPGCIWVWHNGRWYRVCWRS